MWLPLGNSFHRNDTLQSILTGSKYHNMRGMIGNSGNGNSIVSNPWMTALAAASAKMSGDHQTGGLMDFGAACWYFGQKITDLGIEAGTDLTATGEPIPLGMINTAIGGQRIEEYQVNDTVSSPEQCGGKPSDWNGRLFARMVMPFTDMTTFGFLWYQGARAHLACLHPLTIWTHSLKTHVPLLTFSLTLLPSLSFAHASSKARITWAELKEMFSTTSGTHAIKRRSLVGGAKSGAPRRGLRTLSPRSVS